MVSQRGQGGVSTLLATSFCGIFNSFLQFFSALFNLKKQFETDHTYTKYTLVQNLAQLHTEMVLGRKEGKR
ncbi:MAG: hypothetical protein ACHBN1_26710 [Heteroscytonema crispum UTEX LB 1556]